MIPTCVRHAISAVLIVVLAGPLGLYAPAWAQAAEEPGGEAQLRGRISSLDGSSVTGATVIAYHLSSEQVYKSESIPDSGDFVIDNLPYGYYDIAVQAPAGLFVADQVINLPPSGKATLNLSLSRGGTDGASPRGFPGTEEPPVGIAMTDQKDKGSFWTSAGGIAVIAGAGAVLLAAIALSGGSDDEEPASPQ
jgi:hypothetical protein